MARIRSLAAGAVLLGTLMADGALAAQPPAQLVDDHVAGSMRATTGALGTYQLPMKFGSHTGTWIELQFQRPEGDSVQLIVPVTPGTVPLSTEGPDVDRGLGYLDWAISGAPRPPKGCTASWTESDGVARGTVDCPKQGKGKAAFRFRASFVAEPVDAWRACRPGFVLAAAPANVEPSAEPGDLPASSQVPDPAGPAADAQPSPPADLPAPDVIWASLEGPPVCVPADDPGPSPAAPIDACALLTVEEVAGLLAVEPAALTVDGSEHGRCRYLRVDGYGLAVHGGAGVNVTPPRPIAGAGCTAIDLEEIGVRGFDATCYGPEQAWSVDAIGASTETAGVMFVIAAPSLGGTATTDAETLLGIAVSRLP